jgi:DNA-binding IclR family transcriptional regulator
MPTRRDAIATAVDAYNRANPLAPLLRSAGRLLEVMFADADTCQLSLDALGQAAGFSPQTVHTALRTLVAAGFVAKQTGQGASANRYRLLLALGSGA